MPKHGGGSFWIYVWLAVSVLLNITSMASIAEGAVVWVHFIQNFIDLYQTTIRDPIAGAFNTIWPFGKLPAWVFDIAVVFVSLSLAINIFEFMETGQTIFGNFDKLRKKSGSTLSAAGLFFLMVLFPPIAISMMYFGKWPTQPDSIKHKEAALNTMKIWSGIVFLFLLVLFVNWQFSNL